MRERETAVRRIVAIRPGALGDTLLAFPALALLRRSYPDAHITLIARRDVLPLARAWGLADAVSPFDEPRWSAFFAPVPPVESSVRATLDGAIAVAWLADQDGRVAANLRALGAKTVVIGPGRPREDRQTHAALQLARVFSALGIAPPTDTAALPPLHLPTLVAIVGAPPAAPGLLDTVGASDGRPPRNAETPEGGLMALHAGSGGAAKRWPPARFAALAGEIRTLGLCPVLIEGPQDGSITSAVLAEAARLHIELAVARNLDVLALARLLTGCAGYVGNDSGVSHLAGLLGLRTLALFGPSDPAIWSPLGPRVHVQRSPTGALTDLSVATVAASLHADLLP
ncbi:MAG TPA: glycosyltransferase family 9 protein [Ktedonobacterales bacterium]|nr:glycosyltransferase family 9 protein [Ktedonobacterales bacterium]